MARYSELEDLREIRDRLIEERNQLARENKELRAANAFILKHLDAINSILAICNMLERKTI